MATYYVWSGATGAANGTSWTDAYTSLGNLFTGAAIAGGDIIYIASDHDNGSYAANKTFNFPETSSSTSSHVRLISANRTSGLPEVGAIEQTGGNYSIALDHRLYCYGVTFKTGSGGADSSANIKFGDIFGPSYGKMQLIKCTFNLNSTSTSPDIYTHKSSYPLNILFDSCTFIFGATGQSFGYNGGRLELVNCGISGTPPTTFLQDKGGVSVLLMSGCDFSAATNLVDTDRLVTLIALNSLVPSNIITTPTAVAGSYYMELHACGSTDHNYFYGKHTNEGDVTHDVAVYLTSGGATNTDNDGSSVPYSLKLASNANSYNCSIDNPLYTPWLHVPVYSTGSKTFSVKVAHTEVSSFKDNEVWLEVEFMGGSATINTPQTERQITAPLISSTLFQDMLAAGSSLTDTAEAWTGITSEITHTLSKAVTVDEQGYARVRVAFAVNNKTLYVNPDVTVT